MERFDAKLLFHCRMRVGKEGIERRMCEERIVNFETVEPDENLKMVKF